jgi:NADP-dependent 3-hydroxy acid dehydrogenase YdfG
VKKLENKVAVIYRDGSIGGAIAKAFARESATVFLTSHTLSKLDSIADEILFGGGAIENAQLKALDKQDVEKHMN